MSITEHKRSHVSVVLVTLGAVLAVVGVVFGVTMTSRASAAQAAADAQAPVTSVVTKTMNVMVTETKSVPVTVKVTETKSVPVTVTAEPPAPPVPTGPAVTLSKSGTFVVGTDIKAGKWKSDGKIDGSRSSGYFAILKDPTGSTSDVDNILTNDNPEGQAFATLSDGQGLENNNLKWTWISD